VNHREQILGNLNAIQSVPASALQAMRKLQDPNANMGEIVQIINYDPGMTSNILKLANSSYFGCTRTISSLRDAVVRLGVKRTFELVTAAIASAAIKTKIRGYKMTSDELWDHSVAVAVAAENLADILKVEGEKIAFTAGLLHDIGKVLIGKHLVDKRNRKMFQDALDANDSILRTELVTLGVGHAEVGGKLLESWNIPENLVNAVRWHHDPSTCEDLNPSIINYADTLCIEHNIGYENPDPKLEKKPEVLKKLNITNEITEEVVLRTKDSFDTIKDVFSGR
jgi:putative nucleotidyltransferase with HDIG domain